MAHLADADMIRLKDGECDDAEERAFREHLAECAECRESAQRIDRLVEGLVMMVDSIDYPKEVKLPARISERRGEGTTPRTLLATWFTRRSVQLAAAIAVVVALGLTTTPARAVVKAGWQAIVGVVSRGHDVRAPRVRARSTESAPPLVAVDSGVSQPISKRASFVPRGGEFLVVFAHTQSAGALLVAVDTTNRATVVALGDADADELVVSGAGIRIANSEASTASYALTVPASLRSVVVRLAGQAVATLSPIDLLGRGTWRLDLTSGAAR